MIGVVGVVEAEANEQDKNWLPPHPLVIHVIILLVRATVGIIMIKPLPPPPPSLRPNTTVQGDSAKAPERVEHP